MSTLDASPIWNDRLYMGSFPQPGTNVGAEGFDLLVICAMERLHFLGSPSESYTAAAFSCRTVHAPFDDGEVTDEVVAAAVRGAKATVRALADGEKVLVTCNAGRNRSGLVVAVSLLALFPKMSPEDVVELVRRRRKAPSGLALTNEDFVTLIRCWKRP